MRRIAILGLVLLLPACESWDTGIHDFVASPFVGFGGAVGDAITFHRNPNQPPIDSDNISRARGIPVDTAPLLPEPGNVWPGPPRPEPTLQDVERLQNQAEPAATPPNPTTPVAPHPQPRGSSAPPVPLRPSNGPVSAAPPAPAPSYALPPPLTGVVQTPQGAAVITNTGNGVQTYTLPNGSSGRAISNGNGTVTLIGPDGAVQSVPAPR